MTRTPRIAVIGGGIGGLVAAQALRLRGVEVLVYEGAPELREIGAGVALAPNAMKALRALSLEDAVRAIAWEPESHTVRSWRSGRAIMRNDHRVTAQRYGAAACFAHRADMLDALAAALPDGVVTLGARASAVRTDGDTASATFTDGRQVEADAIVGADGIHSAVRESLFGADAPRFTGKICYRSLIAVDAIPGGPPRPERATWVGPHGAVVVYGVRRGELINVASHYEDPDFQHESWITQCDRAEVIARYAGWHRSLERLFSASEDWYKWALYDRDPIARWTRGRVTLLGDAAHPMLPYLGQGACQAVEDGCVLAAALAATPGDVPAALARYEQSRRPRASAVVLAARARGVDNHLSSPLAALRRDAAIAVRRRLRTGGEARGGGWIWEYDAGSPDALAPSP